MPPLGHPRAPDPSASLGLLFDRFGGFLLLSGMKDVQLEDFNDLVKTSPVLPTFGRPPAAQDRHYIKGGLRGDFYIL